MNVEPVARPAGAQEREIQAVIFDVDGTLLNTIPAIVAGWNAALLPIAGREYSVHEVLDRFGPFDEQMLELELRHFPGADLSHAIEVYFEAYTRAHDQVSPFPGIQELVDHLSAHVALGVMTGKSRRALEITFQSVGWDGQFAVKIAGNEVARPKPAADGPLKAAAELGVMPAHCVYVGDSPADYHAARSAGMRAVFAGWHSHFAHQMQGNSPDLWANHPLDVLEFFRAHRAAGRAG